MLTVASVASAWLLLACEEEPPPPAPPPPPPPRTAVAAPRVIATRAAFDLAPSSEGALFFFGPPAAEGGGVKVLPLGPEGERLRAPSAVWTPTPNGGAPPPHVIEIAAAAGGGRAGVAWVAREGRALRVHQSHGTGTAFSPPSDLGRMEEPPRVVRGNVALAAAPDGTIGLIYRRERGPCVGRAGQCAQLRVQRLGHDGGSERSGMPLVIPAVCDTPTAGYAWADGTWYYGLCATSDGGSSTTVYAIRYDPQYAQADEALAGCEPLGMARVGEGAAVVVGRCQNGFIDAVRYGEMGTERLALSGVTRTVSCEEGRPRLVLTAAEGTLSVDLAEPAGDLAALLPDDVAPDGARAIWTGESLLLAAPLGHEVGLQRYECEDGHFLRTDNL